MSVFKRIKSHTHTAKFAPLVLLLLLGSANTAIAQADNAQANPLPLEEVRMFTEALDRIRHSYVEEIDDKTLLEYAIRGMLSGLDPHSSYLIDTEYDNLQDTTNSQFGGLGVEVGREDGYIKVISPIDNTPAARAGILPGDLIIQIDNKPLREMLPNEATKMMRGEPGTDITITIAREGQEPFDLTLTREIIPISSVRSRMLAPGYAYIRISQFRTNTGDDVQSTLQKLHTENETLNGIVLDLRNNPGGVLQASVGVVDAFITEGDIVSTRGRLSENNMSFSATSNNPGGDTPLVVLINGGSASASEIVAGALQDHSRAVIMGTRSFGKGSVQTLLQLAERRSIKLTTSLYYTPSGRSIQAQGIEPDIIVEEALVTKRSRNSAMYTEADLDGHLANGNDADDGDVENSEATSQELIELALVSADRVLVSDYPLNEALNLLKGLNSLQPKNPSTDISQQTANSN